MNLLWKLLGKHVSVPQFAGFVLADLLGMLIVLFGWQFYKDVSPALDGGDNLFGSDYVIVNKKVGLLSGKGGFSEKELKTIREQPFAREVGVFSAASYEVFGDISVAGVELASTELFFESVPDSFVDFADKDRKWTFDPESGAVLREEGAEQVRGPLRAERGDVRSGGGEAPDGHAVRSRQKEVGFRAAAVDA